jgi:uncharacterized protein (UPF0218 family)
MHKTILGKRFCLPDAMRSEMRKPFGVLYRGEGEDTARQMLADMGRPAKLIAIGDISTFNLLKHGTVPDISVIDKKTHREPAGVDIIKVIRHSNFRDVNVKNPPGFVESELVSALSDAMDADVPVQIMVNGEEDLAALPAIVLAPVSSVVIYGLPDEGGIMVTVTPGIKDLIYGMLDKMKCD